MNSLLYYYNNVQKMAAYRQAKRMQCGVKLGENQSVGGSTTAKFVSNPIPIGTDDFTVEFYGSMCGSNVSYASLFNAASPSAGGDRTFSFYSRYYPNNGIYGILFSPDTDGDSLGDQVVVQYEPGDNSKFLVSVTRQGTTVKVYINGELKATKEQSEVKDLGDLQLAIANSSDLGFVRVWNMCLSADDVTEHYNNGDPMGYVVPKAMRGLEPVEITGSNSYTWTGVDSVANVGIITNPNIEYGKFYVVNISVSDYEAGSPYLYIGYSYGIPKVNGNYNILIEHQYQSSNTILLFGGPYGTDRRLTLTVNSITPVGLLAEYLPQNLMGQKEKPLQIIGENSYTWENVTTGAPTLDIRTNPSIKTGVIYRVNLTVSGFIEGEQYLYAGSRVSIPSADGTYDLLVTPSGNYDYISVYGGTNIQLKNLTITVNKVEIANATTSWLDSAKQLPLSDESMEPLFQSVGGYDMAADGAPEILYNE